MSNSERGSKASVSVLWTEVHCKEPVLVSIRNGSATVRVYHFDFDIPGEFEDGDIEGVMEAHHKQLNTKVTITALPDDWEPPPWNPSDGFDPIADFDSEEVEKHEVIYLPKADK